MFEAGPHHFALICMECSWLNSLGVIKLILLLSFEKIIQHINSEIAKRIDRSLIFQLGTQFVILHSLHSQYLFCLLGFCLPHQTKFSESRDHISFIIGFPVLNWGLPHCMCSTNKYKLNEGIILDRSSKNIDSDQVSPAGHLSVAANLPGQLCLSPFCGSLFARQ